MATIKYFDNAFRSWGIVKVPVILEKDVPASFHQWGFNVDAAGKGYYHFFKSDVDDSLVAVDHCNERKQQEDDGDKKWWDNATADMMASVSEYTSKQLPVYNS